MTEVVAPPKLEPVRLYWRQHHAFEKKEDGKRGCAVCGGAKGLEEHAGTPPSLNVFGSGANKFVYQNHKKLWERILAVQLRASGLPKGLGGVLAEATMCFGDHRARDQGNYRFILEKALGDVLQREGYLVNDDWAHYEFGNLFLAYEPRARWTEVVIFPRMEERAAPEPGALF